MTDEQTPQPNPETTHETVQYFQADHQDRDNKNSTQRQKMDTEDTDEDATMDDKEKNRIQHEKEELNDGDNVMGMDDNQGITP